MPAPDDPARSRTTTVPDGGDVALLGRRPVEAPAGTIPTQRDRAAAPATSEGLSGPGAPGASDASDRHPDRAAGGADAARRAGVRRAVLIVALCLVVVGAVATAVVLQLRADARAAAWARAQERVAAAYAAEQVDESFWTQARTVQAAARYDGLVAAAVARADAVLTGARAAAEASPQAGTDVLAALTAATDAAAAAVDAAGHGASPAALAASTAAVAAPQKAAVDAQAAWQAAEDARIAAEQAAAERAAAEAAQRAAAARSTGSQAARPATTSSGGGGASAPAAAAAPAATAWAAGVTSYGIGGLGAEINAARAANGLPGLAVVGSSTLANHAAAMAAAGTIWHSGSDHIVGWVEPTSDAEMINAYLNSPPHRAWILKGDRSTVAIGAVTLNGRLYTAMLFS